MKESQPIKKEGEKNRETPVLSSEEYRECERLVHNIQKFSLLFSKKNSISKEDMRKIRDTVLNNKQLVDKALKSINGFEVGIKIANAAKSGVPDPILRATINEIIKNNISRIDREITNTETLGVLGGQHAIYCDLIGGVALRERALKRDSSHTLAILQKHAPSIKEGFISSPGREHYVSALTQLAEEGDRSSLAALRTYTEQLFEHRVVRSPSLEEIIRILLSYDCPKLKSVIVDTLQKRLGGKKSYTHMIEAWKLAGPNLRKIVKDNITTILHIEQQEPGAVATLYNDFGICNFGRYPETMLLAQVRQKENVSQPYGILLYPQSDENGAFFGQKKIFEKMFQGIQGIYGIRIVEAKSVQEIARLLISLDTKYGAQEKISFALIGGHGSTKSIVFGDDEISGKLRVEDLLAASAKKERGEKSGIVRTQKFFMEHPFIALISCHGGKEGAAAQHLSSIYDATVLGPSDATWIKNITIQKENDKPVINVEYMKKNEMKPIEGVTYITGKKHTDIEPMKKETSTF